MNDEERGKLLVEKERVEKSIKEIDSEIKSKTKELKLICERILKNPLIVQFSNVPNVPTDNPIELINEKFTDFTSIPKLDEIALLIHNFREKINYLNDITKRLKKT